jgi:hypothetical protein
MHIRVASVVLMLCWLCGAPAAAEIYRWTDSAGRERFSNRIDDVPAAQREEALRRAASSRSRVSTVESAKPQAGAVPSPATPARLTVPAARDAASGAEKIGGDDEAGWRARASKLRGEIERLEGAAEQCAESAPVRWNRGAGRRAYEEEAREAAGCQRTSGDLQGARIQLDKLVENARKLGVPPGWVR